MPRAALRPPAPRTDEPGKAWAGAYSTVTTAMAEWMTNRTFDDGVQGQITDDESGLTRATGVQVNGRQEATGLAARQ